MCCCCCFGCVCYVRIWSWIRVGFSWVGMRRRGRGWKMIRRRWRGRRVMLMMGRVRWYVWWVDWMMVEFLRVVVVVGL